MADIIHILNGDALREVFPTDLKGDLIIFREMMMEGPVNTKSIGEFISIRREYLNKFYNTEHEEYHNKSARELEKICSIKANSKVFLWFEYDLFCQVNMWCVIYMLTSWNNVNNIEIVYPSPAGPSVDWHGFAAIKPHKLSSLLKESIPLQKKDITLANKIWMAYGSSDIVALQQLSNESSSAFPLLNHSIQDHLNRLPLNGRAGTFYIAISSLINKHGKEHFEEIFREFSSTYGRYGMGDLQVKRLVDTYTHPIN